MKTIELIKRAIPDPPLPGTAEWYHLISASKVASIVGLSPWKSRFALWHEMKGNVEPEGDNSDKERGRYLEPAVRQWFRDKHPEMFHYDPTTFHHAERTHWIASLDGLAEDMESVPVGVECKTSADGKEWGKPGTCQIPPYYLVQAWHQMFVTGVETVHFPVLFGSNGFKFSEYVVTWDDVEEDTQFLLNEIEQFESSLRDNVMPQLDGSDSTYRAVKKLHPLIEDEKIDLPFDLVYDFLRCHEEAERLAVLEARAKNAIAMRMGNAKRGVYGKHTIMTRQARGEGTPYPTVGRSLPSATTVAKENANNGRN